MSECVVWTFRAVSSWGELDTSVNGALSNDLDCGENTGMVVTAMVGATVHIVRDIPPDAPSNMCTLAVFEWTHATPQSWCLNDVAPMNMLVTLNTSHFEISTLNTFAFENVSLISKTRETSHFAISHTNVVVPENILSMFVTRERFHFEMSALNFPSANMSAIFVTRDTFHRDISLSKYSTWANIPSMSATFDTSHFEMSS